MAVYPPSPRERSSALTSLTLATALGCFPSEDLASYTGSPEVSASTGSASPSPQPAGDASLAPSVAGQSETGAGSGEGSGPQDRADLIDPGASDNASSTVDGPLESAFEMDASSPEAPTPDAATLRACDARNGVLGAANDSCYRFFDGPSTWDAAEDACADIGATLVQIEDRDEEAFLEQGMVVDSWIGAASPPGTPANVFVWPDGTVLGPTAHDNWEPGEPDNQPNQLCVAKQALAPAYAWHDQTCSLGKGYICEWSL